MNISHLDNRILNPRLHQIESIVTGAANISGLRDLSSSDADAALVRIREEYCAGKRNDPFSLGDVYRTICTVLADYPKQEHPTGVRIAS